VFDGEDLTGGAAERLRVTRRVLQEPMTALNPSYTVGDQLADVHHRHKHSTRRAAADRAVEFSKN
jgi:ABC-type microcin C transport system duplicated ATPase subunit YejF